MRDKLFILAFWAALGFALIMAALPEPPSAFSAPSDKVQHIFAFMALAGLAATAYPGTSLIRIGLGLSLFGGLIEVVQAIPSLQRSSELADWVADTVATIVVLMLAAIVRKSSAAAGELPRK